MRNLVAILIMITLSGCGTAREPISTVAHVDLERFMGRWYVIANIPTSLERDAHNAIESYQLEPDGTIATTFTFNKGSFDGPARRYTPRGFVKDRQSNAVWGMRFVWPVKSDYRIVHVDETYTVTVIGRQKRDYVWIMARTPVIPEDTYQGLLQIVAREGYDIGKVRRVPQEQAGSP